jgi:hypothetical protein
MRSLILLLLVVAAAWFGWKQYPNLIERRPAHQAVIQNDSGTGITRIRLEVDGQTLARESLPEDQKTTIPFRVNRDASFVLIWEWADRPGEMSWRGGMIPRGPMLQRHTFRIDPEGAVDYRAENL